jgi:hypothetical protein
VNLHLDKRGRLWVSTLRGVAILESGTWRELGKEIGWDGDPARTFAERSQRALDGGAVAYLRKPVDDEALLSAIAVAVGPREMDKGE